MRRIAASRGAVQQRVLVPIAPEIYAGVRGRMLGRGVRGFSPWRMMQTVCRRRGSMNHFGNPVKDAALLVLQLKSRLLAAIGSGSLLDIAC